MCTADGKKKSDDLSDALIEINCFNCANKEICIIVKSMFPIEFRSALAKVASRPDMQKFYEAVEKMLARICQSFQETQ